MCFSKEASIFSFLIGIIGAILCISLGSTTDKIIGYFLGFVSSMQGLEFLLWSHQVCDDYNKIVSNIAMVFNHLQPIALGVIFLLLNSKKENNTWIILAMILYLFIIIPYSDDFVENKEIQCTMKNNENQHLIWKWNSMDNSIVVYSIFLLTLGVLCLLGFPSFKHGVYAAIFAAFSFFTSVFLYSPETIGALWCYYVVYAPITYYVLRKVFVEV